MESIPQVMLSLDTNEEERETFLDIITKEGKTLFLVSPVTSVCQVRSVPSLLVSTLPPLHIICSQSTERDWITHVQVKSC